MRTFGAGVHTNHRPLVRTNSRTGTHTNPGAARLRCESDRTSVRSCSKSYASLEVTGTRKEETDCQLDIWVLYPIDIPSPLCTTTHFHPTVRQKHVKIMEKTHKHADAFNTFGIRMSEKELDRSADHCISRWMSTIDYFSPALPPPFFYLTLYPAYTIFSND